jgi:hypothetical protein
MICQRWFLVACTVLLASVLVRGDEAKTARATLDRAIKAMGGAALLGKHPALAGKSQGKMTVNTKTSPVTNEWLVQGLDQVTWTTRASIPGSSASGSSRWRR